MNTPVVIAFNKKYLVPASVTLSSLVSVSTGSFHIICLLVEELSDEEKSSFEKVGKGRATFEYRLMTGKLSGVKVSERFSEATYYRLLLPEILPEYESVIYVDCDVVIRQDVGELYRTIELSDNYVAAVYEAPIEKQPLYISSIGCDPKRYFNAGFLLMNLKEMRKDSLSSKMVAALISHDYQFLDQDVLNVLCKDRVYALLPKYNSIRTFFLPQYRVDFHMQYPNENWDELQKDATIHYTGGKPWNTFTIHFGEWWRTYDSLPTEIKGGWKPKYSVWLLSRMFSIRFVGSFIERVMYCYRTIKSR